MRSSIEQPKIRNHQREHSRNNPQNQFRIPLVYFEKLSDFLRDSFRMYHSREEKDAEKTRNPWKAESLES